MMSTIMMAITIQSPTQSNHWQHRHHHPVTAMEMK
jgi:hypothetical protein